MKEIVQIGLNRPIESSDIYKTLDDHQSSRVIAEYEKEWDREREKSNPKLYKLILRQYPIFILFIGPITTLIGTFVA